MIEIKKHIYEEVYKKLLGEIGPSNFISSRNILGEFDGVKYNFIISAVIYRDDFEHISEIIPVWWEFHTEIDGVEKMNDFFFHEMMKIV